MTTITYPHPSWTRRLTDRLKSSFPVSTSPVLVPLLGVILLFVSSGAVLRSIDPIAAVVDLGVLSLVLLGLLAALSCVSICHWLLGLLWPMFRQYKTHQLPHHFNTLSPWKRIALYYTCFFLLLYAILFGLLAVF